MSQMIEKLKKYLATASQEEFDRDWNAVESMNFGGPDVDEFMASFRFSKAAAYSTNTWTFTILGKQSSKNIADHLPHTLDQAA